MTSTLLKNGLKQLGLSMPAEQQKRMLAFLTFLQQWNRAYNLTAIHDIDKMVTYHVLDSLSIAPYLTGNRIIDVGTGAGFPGIPLAFFYPKKQLTLLDSNGKKTRFLIQAKAAFAIDNIDIIHSRVERYHTEPCFDTVIFRAVKPIQEMIDQTSHLCCKNGHFFAMKAGYPTEELKAISKLATVQALTVPGLDAQRHLVILPF